MGSVGQPALIMNLFRLLVFQNTFSEDKKKTTTKLILKVEGPFIKDNSSLYKTCAAHGVCLFCLEQRKFIE